MRFISTPRAAHSSGVRVTTLSNSSFIETTPLMPSSLTILPGIVSSRPFYAQIFGFNIEWLTLMANSRRRLERYCTQIQTVCDFVVPIALPIFVLIHVELWPTFSPKTGYWLALQCFLPSQCPQQFDKNFNWKSKPDHNVTRKLGFFIIGEVHILWPAIGIWKCKVKPSQSEEFLY